MLFFYVPVWLFYVTTRITLNCAYITVGGAPMIEECQEVLELALANNNSFLSDSTNWREEYIALRAQHLSIAFEIPKEGDSFIKYMNNEAIPVEYRPFLEINHFTRKSPQSPICVGVHVSSTSMYRYFEVDKNGGIYPYGSEPKCIATGQLPAPLSKAENHPMIYKTLDANKQVYLGAVCTSSNELP
jgi:hypothetical protein